MPCGHCGSDALPVEGRCPACGAPASAETTFPSNRAAGTRIQDPSSTLLRSDGEGMTMAATVLPAAGAVHHTVHATGPLGTSDQFGSRYRIIRLLGSGGMGSVYQAWDQELDVAVAVKVIRPEVLADPKVAEELERR